MTDTKESSQFQNALQQFDVETMRKILQDKPPSQNFTMIQQDLSAALGVLQDRERHEPFLSLILENVELKDRLKLLQTKVGRENELKTSLVFYILSIHTSFVEKPYRILKLLKERLSDADWKRLFKLISDLGQTILHVLCAFQVCTDCGNGLRLQCLSLCMEGFSSKERLKLLQQQDFFGSTPLYYCWKSPSNDHKLATLKAVIGFFGNDFVTYDFFLTPCRSGGGTLAHKLIEEASADSLEKDDGIKFRHTTTTSESLKFEEWASECVGLCYMLQMIKDQDVKVRILSTVDDTGESPMHIVKKDYLLPLILEGMDERSKYKLLTLKDKLGNTPLHKMNSVMSKTVSALMNQSSFLEILKLKNFQGETVLHALAQENPSATMELLNWIKPPTSELLLIKNGHGLSIIHSMMSLLGKDSMFKRRWGQPRMPRTLIELLEIFENKFEAVRLLCDKDCDGLSSLHIMSRKYPEYLEPILGVLNNCDISDALSVVDKDDNTPIHILCRDHPLFLQSVLAKVPAGDLKGILMLQNGVGNTAIHILAHHQSSLILAGLLAKLKHKNTMSSVLAVKNKQEATAFHIACALQNISTVSSMVGLVGKREALSLIDEKPLLDVEEAISIMSNESENKVTVCAEICKFSVFSRPCIPLVLVKDARQDLEDCIQEIADADVEREIQNINAMTAEQLNTDLPRLTEDVSFVHRNTILHCLAERDDTTTMIKLLDAMSVGKRADMLAKQNFGGQTPFDLAKSYEFRRLIDWSHAQQGFYYLPTPPSVLIMYTTANRDGAEIEKEDLRKAFPEFNVRVEIRTNPSQSDMLGAITDVQHQHADMSALVVIIMSHGASGTVCAGDGREVLIQDILNQMCSQSLQGKPKVLLIQACQSATRDINVPVRPAADPVPAATQPRTTGFTPTASRNFSIPSRDVITMVATVNGGVAYRNQMIPMFAEELCNATHQGDIYEIFLRTHYRFHMRHLNQIPEFCSTLTQKLSLRNIFKPS